MLADWLAE